MTPDKALQVGEAAVLHYAKNGPPMTLLDIADHVEAATTLAALRAALREIVPDLREILNWGATTGSDREMHRRMLERALAALAPEGGQT